MLFRTIAVLAALTAATGAASAEPLKIRIAWSSAPGQVQPLMQHMPKEVIPHWGKTYVVDAIFMQGSGPMLTGLAAKEVDFVDYSYQSFANGVVEAKLDMRLVSDSLSDKPPYRTSGYWYHPDSGIRSVDDLRGRTLAINARGSTNEAGLRKMMSDHGMADGKDYQIVEMRFDALLSALRSRRADLGFLVLPLDMIAEREGFKRLFTMRDALGPAQTVVVGALAEFVAKNRAALVDYYEDDLRMRRWLYDPKNRTEMLEIVSKVTKRSAADLAWSFTKDDNHRDPGGEIDAVLLQKNVDDLSRLGLIKGTFDVTKYLDLSIVREAAARLK